MGEPVRTPEEIAGLAVRLNLDTGLTPDAARLVMHVFLMGPGEHAVKPEAVSMILGNAGEKQRRAAAERARVRGYLEHRKGGRAGVYFMFTGENTAPVGEDFSESPPVGEDFSRKSAPRGAISPLVVVDAVVEEVPPIVPLRLEPARQAEPRPLHPNAAALLEQNAGKLEGCAAALREYLRARVPPANQAAYVRTVTTMLDGFGFSWRVKATGNATPSLERTRILAAALDDLGASDEAKMKRPVGDPANLKTKLEILLNPREPRGHHYAATGTDGRSGPTRGAGGGGPQGSSPSGGGPAGGRPRIPIT